MNSADRLARLLLLPLGAFVLAFFLLPLVRVVLVAGQGPNGAAEYLAVLTNPRHLTTLLSTLACLRRDAGDAGRRRRRGAVPGAEPLSRPRAARRAADPAAGLSRRGGGFHDHPAAGRQGLIGGITQSLGMGKLVFAYSMGGLFAGYVYFSLPRVLVTLMAAVEKLDPALTEAARSLGAGRLEVLRDVTLPA